MRSMVRQHTLGDSVNDNLDVAIGLCDCKDEVVVGPFWEHVAHEAQLSRVGFLHVAQFALLVERVVELHGG